MPHSIESTTCQRVADFSSASARRTCSCYDGNVVDQLSGNQPYPIIASRLNDLVAIHQRKADGPLQQSRNENEADGNYN